VLPWYEMSSDSGIMEEVQMSGAPCRLSSSSQPTTGKLIELLASVSSKNPPDRSRVDEPATNPRTAVILSTLVGIRSSGRCRGSMEQRRSEDPGTGSGTAEEHTKSQGCPVDQIS